jgi:3-phosphoshikimate 1-carboxyvinyltransferase
MTTDHVPDPFTVAPVSGPLDADLVVPGSKSITNRALLAAALADGASRLTGVLFADDTEAMIDGLVRLGFDLEIDRAGNAVTVHGGGGRLPARTAAIDARLSGTTSRFLLPALALGEGPYRLDGAPPLRARPIADGVAAVRALGARVELAPQVTGPPRLPVTVSGGPHVRGGVVEVAGAVSSQFLSGLLLIAAALPDGLEVVVTGGLVSQPYVTLTQRVLEHFGGRVRWLAPNRLRVEPGGLHATDLAIEPDASAASYPFAAAAICGGRVRVRGLHRDAWQGDIAFLQVLGDMGAIVEDTPDGLEVRAGNALAGVHADLGAISDTAQTLAAVAVFARSVTEVRGIGFIRAKETDRIGAVVTELRRCGIEANETPDGFVVHPGPPQPAVVQTYDDHRMAMSFALLGLKAQGIAIADPGCVRKTFPGYWSMLDALRDSASAR